MMNQDKLKQMYAEGGLLKALLKDPAQREMARKMLTMEEGGMMKKYRMGGSMEYANGGEVDPPKGTRMAGEFVSIEEPDLYAAYSDFAYPNQYGPMREGLAKLSESERESVIKRASRMAAERFEQEAEGAEDKMEFMREAYESGRYEPGMSYRPRMSGPHGAPVTEAVDRATKRAVLMSERLSPALKEMFGL
jgi:hypothetical protein